MDWKELLKSQGYTDAEISKMETEFGGDKLAKAFSAPLAEKEAAVKLAAEAQAAKEEQEKWYQDEILPKVSSVYQDAINWRTKASSLEERLKAAKEYGFLAETENNPVVTPPVNPVPGSPAGPPASTSTLDPRYVEATAFTKAVNDIPDMLGRLTKMSNEHFSLFGSPLMDVDTLITEARNQKKNVVQVWEAKYKVPEKRKEITDKIAADHDRQVAEEAVRKYASEHGQPFSSIARPSVSPVFSSASTDDARKPWKGAVQRQSERRQKLLQEFQKSGSNARVQ